MAWLLGLDSLATCERQNLHAGDVALAQLYLASAGSAQVSLRNCL